MTEAPVQTERDERFLRLLAEHEAAVRRLASSHERDGAKQQDLIQEIWLAVWQALPRFRGDCSERTFVFRIAHNRAITHIDHCRRRQTEVLEPDEPIADPAPDPERALSQQQRQARLQAAVQQLPLNLRQTIVLALEGLSHQDIAEIIGISSNNVAVRLTRARASLARLLGAAKEPS